MQFYLERKTRIGKYHFLHSETCSLIPAGSESVFIGAYLDNESALEKAYTFYNFIKCCSYCCYELKRTPTSA